MIDTTKDVNTIFDMGKPAVNAEEPVEGASEPSSETEEVVAAVEEPKEEVEPETVPKEHYENIKKAMQSDRAKSKAELESLRQRVAGYESKVATLEKDVQKSALQDVFNDLEDEDVLTVAGAKKLVELQRTEYEDRLGQSQTTINALVMQVAEDGFRTTHKDYDEVVAPYMDRTSDPDFVKSLFSGGPAKVPEKFYEYAKKQQTEADLEMKVTKKVSEKLKPLGKPQTMDKKSHSKKMNTDYSKLSETAKRNLSSEEIDEMWMQDME